METIRRIVVALPSDAVVIHGDARGADTIAGRLAEESGLRVIAFPAAWGRYGRAAGSLRNAQMLEEGRPDVVYAFAVDLAMSRGTADMVARARRAGVKTFVDDRGSGFSRCADTTSGRTKPAPGTPASRRTRKAQGQRSTT